MRITDGVLSGGRHSSDFYDVISLEHLLCAWRKFSKGKRTDSEVAKFELCLEENLFSLHERLAQGVWTNDPYRRQPVADLKPRVIHIPSVRDRVLFQAVYQALYQIFDKTFIHDSYASGKCKGTHTGVNRFETFAQKVSANHTKPAFVLKCDIKKFFANIYLNELDQFVKHKLKVRYYIRYCDDFVILDNSHKQLLSHISALRAFLNEKLLLELHPSKVTIRKLHQGTDFLGYVSLPHYRVLRTKTKQRMLARVSEKNVASYLGMLSHCCSHNLTKKILAGYTKAVQHHAIHTIYY